MNPKASTILLTISILTGACGSTTVDEPVAAPEKLVIGGALDGVPVEDDIGPFEVEVDGIEAHEVEVPPLEPTTTTQSSTDNAATSISPPQPEPIACRAFVLEGPTFPSNQADLTTAGQLVVGVAVVTEQKRQSGVAKWPELAVSGGFYGV